MKFGNKIFELRKKAHFSQEELAEKLGVTRQTVSKWELEETAPDIKQATILAQLFRVSLDELVGNDVQILLKEKESNVEKLAGMVFQILNSFCIFVLVAFIVIILIMFIRVIIH